MTKTTHKDFLEDSKARLMNFSQINKKQLKDRTVKGFLRPSQSKQYLSHTGGPNGNVELTDSDNDFSDSDLRHQK